MRIEFQKTTRIPRWPPWAVGITVFWLALVATLVLLSGSTGLKVEACLFRRITSYPCPGCGATRGVLQMLQGRFGQAWLLNPLLFTALWIWILLLVSRLLTAKSLVITGWSKSSRRRALLVGIVAVLGNWLYVLHLAV